jgi:hypothetical protein
MATTTSPAVLRPERSIAIIAGLVVILVAAAVAAVLTLGNRPPAEYPPDSPQAAFIGYVRAFEARDPETAYSYFSQKVKRTMTFEQFTDPKEYGRPLPIRERNTRLRIDRVEVTGDRATLWLTTEYFTGSGLSADRYTVTEELQLVREDGAWKIDERLGWRN